jgi:RNA polymerase-interacting CarD/CdnL/TRCF family regulator
MFKVGDAVVHPTRGAGIVIDVEELRRRGDTEPYYNIDLLAPADTILMIPVNGAESQGVREAIQRSHLGKVWHVLQEDPEKLPSNYRTRHKLLNDKLYTGDILKVAEAVRDMAWRRRGEGLTTRGRRIYKKGMRLLAGEIAAAQEIGLADAKAQVRKELRRSLPSSAN